MSRIQKEPVVPCKVHDSRTRSPKAASLIVHGESRQYRGIIFEHTHTHTRWKIAKEREIPVVESVVVELGVEDRKAVGSGLFV